VESEGAKSEANLLAEGRTDLAFQRTRMAAERTLMAVLRTSLSLIGFGFTIHQMFSKLYESHVLTRANSARRFGISLVALGIAMLGVGIGYHLKFMQILRRDRAEAKKSGMVLHGGFPVSLTVIVALLLFALGVVTLLSDIFDAGPFGGD
jgi:putative membrane protein